MGDEEEREPLWLSHENDHIHQTRVNDETEPLFGSGKLPLEGEAKEETTPFSEGDVESQANYGSIKKGDDKAPSVASSKTPSSSRNKGGSKKATKAKQKQKRGSPPPKSIFDEESDKDIDENSSVTDTLNLDTKPHIPGRNWCLDSFRVISGVTVIASLGLLATQLIPLCLGGLTGQGYFDLALKVYVIMFCILFLLVESDSPVPFIRNSQLLNNYISRGFVYSFLGLICLEEAYSVRVKEIVSTHADAYHVSWASLFMQISSWLIFACGCLYMLMGLCCLKRLRDRVREKDRKTWKKYRKELKEWKRLNP